MKSSVNAMKRNDDLKMLEGLKKQFKHRVDVQKVAYLHLLEWVKQRKQTSGKSYRVTESERKIFDALKIITEAGWLINGKEDLHMIFGQIGIRLPLSRFDKLNHEQ